MAEKMQLQSMSVFHEELLNFIIVDARPGFQTRAAAHFGVTRSWICQIIHTDMFQARLRDRQDEVAGVVVDMRAKLATVADQALDRLADRVQLETDPKVLSDVADKALGRLGYGAPPAGSSAVVNNTQNNYYGVDPANLAAARKRLREKGEEARARSELPAPKSIQGSIEAQVGDDIRTGTLVQPEPAAPQRGSETGNPVPIEGERVAGE